jgi:hypothetical protein
MCGKGGKVDSAKRLALKKLAMDHRMIKRGHTRCDLCDIRDGIEYHEIVSRARTEGAPEEVRDASFQPEICGLVCRECRDNVASTTAGRMLLLLVVINLYGHHNVEAHINMIPFRYRLNIFLPVKEVDLNR